uniref:Cytoskeleton-associated protein 2-like isoform X2 n=1 Tax=Geotrypetes seraphini TaxID=260995 RepID=A0A6P8RJS3_GEOSA|nr:cytoskeleton-associated protein 2-like isoform X2 [Geotrypetes seraphini]
MERGTIVKVTAEEERRKKLLEYLAAKGKLKPQISQSTKPYLKDCTNRQNVRLQQVSKSAPIVKQKGKVPLKQTWGVVPAVKAKSTNATFQSLSNTTTSRRLLGKAVPSVLSRPSSIGKLPSRKCSQQVHTLLSETDQGLKKTTVLSETKAVRTVAKQQTIIIPNDGELRDTVELQNQELSTAEQSSLKKYRCDNKNLPVKTVTAFRNKPRLEINRTGKPRIVSDKPGTKISSVHEQTVNPVTKKHPIPNDIHRIVTSKTQVSDKLDKSKNVSQNLSRLGDRTNGPAVSSGRLGQTYTISRSLPSNKPVHLQSKANLAKQSVQIKRVGPSLPGKTVSIIKSERPNGSKGLPSKKQSFTPVSSKPTGQPNLKSKVTANRNTLVAVKCQQSDCITKKNKVQEAGFRTSKTIHRQYSSITPSTASFTTPKSVVSCLPTRKATTDFQAGLTTTSKKREQDRRNKLEEWLRSKGKTYKRPPMTLAPPKKPEKEKWDASFWDGIEDDEEEERLTDKIHHMLDECLKLIEQGYPSEQLSTVLSRIPEREKFAKFWICKAKLQERDGPFDVFGLYELAVRAGAGPIQELREVVFDIMENTSKKSNAVTFVPLPCEDTSALPKTAASEGASEEFQSSLTERAQKVRTPGAIVTKGWTGEQGSYLKFQVGEIPRMKGTPALQHLKLLTPVRRSVRIEHSVSHYPDILQEHDTVVASLNELLDMEETSAFVYRQNEALPKEIDTQILGL